MWYKFWILSFLPHVKCGEPTQDGQTKPSALKHYSELNPGKSWLLGLIQLVTYRL